ncbi:MAG: hypothetical protein ORN54_13035, partial [Cyclobacteriaceae bacterium]|nr:hypothetical protein [Cyclobacteriaceae bacterium]
ILRAEAGASFDDLVREHGDRLLSEQTKESRASSLRQSRFISAVEYLQVNHHRTVLIEKFNTMIKGCDFIISPTNYLKRLIFFNKPLILKRNTLLVLQSQNEISFVRQGS